MITRRNMLRGLVTAIAAPTVLLTLVKSAQASVTVDTSVWETNDGRLVLIKDMSTPHIVNCIRFIKRSQRMKDYEEFYARCEKFVPVFKAELNKRFGPLTAYSRL